MKFVALLYLEDDAPHVVKLLADHEVASYSELPLDGHGRGVPGWTGKVAPYRSRMALAFVPVPRAAALMDAVRAHARTVDSQHPIHALQFDVERIETSGADAAAG